MRRIFLKTLMLWGVVLWSIDATAAVEIAPGCFTSQFVPVGHPQNMGFTFVVRDLQSEFAIVKILPPEQIVFEVEGYSPLPDVNWFHIGEGETLQLDADGSARAKIWTDFPNDERLYNKHFLVQVLVTGKTMGFMEPTIVANYFIETEPRVNPSVPPMGKIGVAPSIVEVSEENPVGEFEVYNNTQSEQTYTMTVRTPQRESRTSVNLSPGFAPIMDTTKFVFFPKNLTIPAHSHRKVSVRWLSAGALSKSTEAIIMLKDEAGNSDFIRLRLKVTGAK